MPVISRQDVIDSYLQYAGRQPTQAEIDQHQGQTVDNIAAAAQRFFGAQQSAAGPNMEPGLEGFEGLFGGEGFEFPEMTQEEKDLLRTQTDLIKLQMQDLQRQNDLNASLFPEQQELFGQQLQFALDIFPQQRALIEQLMQEVAAPVPTFGGPGTKTQQYKQLSKDQALATMQGVAIPLSDAQRRQLDTIYGEAQRRGTEDLRRFAEEMAAGRGLNLTDTPIGDVALREASNLFSGLQAARAQAGIDLGLQQQQFREGVRQYQDTFVESRRQFQEGLKQQAMQNRLALASGSTQLPQLGQVNAAPLIGSMQGSLNSLAANRSSEAQFGLGVAGLNLQRQQFLEGINQANLNRQFQQQQMAAQYGGGGPSTLQYISALAPVAASAINAGASLAGGGNPFSTARVKKDITPLDEAEFAAAAQARGLPLDAYDEALQALRDTPIARWKYRWEDESTRPHVGPILEMAPAELTDDGWRLRVPDYVGLVHAGLKAVDRKVRRLEAEVS